MALSRFIIVLLIFNSGSLSGMLSLKLSLWKNVYLVLPVFKDNLLVVNQLFNLFSSSFTI